MAEYQEWWVLFSSGYSLSTYSHLLTHLLIHWLIQALLYYLGWMAFHVFLERILPGETAEGVPLDDGKKLKYTLSGHLQFWLTFGVILIALPTFTTDSKSGAVYR